MIQVIFAKACSLGALLLAATALVFGWAVALDMMLHWWWPVLAALGFALTAVLAAGLLILLGLAHEVWRYD